MFRYALTMALTVGWLVSAQVAQAQPVVTDSRIKTLVYNENDVYSLLTHHGYQAHIEFGEKEKIETISLGDRVSWQIIPDGRRLFIRSLLAGAQTNMTVVTNKHSYQFDLSATKGGALPVREDLVYVVRFYYPDEHIDTGGAGMLPPVYADQLLNATQPLPPEPVVDASMLNFSYTYTGESTLAPQRIFDDGQATYFRLPAQGRIMLVRPDMSEVPVPSTRTSDGFEKVPAISPRFVVRYPDGGYICVYNEKLAGGTL